MPQIGQTFLPLNLDLDTSELYIKSDKSFFLKGITSEWQTGNTAGEFKPEESNYLYCSVTLPEGENRCIGAYEYLEAREVYIVVHNSEGYHLIYRIEAATGSCNIVYRFCKDFSGITKNPKDWFNEGRITIKSICKYSPAGAKILYKELHLVNKKVKNIRIVVEDSIATIRNSQ